MPLIFLVIVVLILAIIFAVFTIILIILRLFNNARQSNNPAPPARIKGKAVRVHPAAVQGYEASGSSGKFM